MRAVIDRMLTGLAWLALRGFFRSLEVLGRDHVPRGRPLLVVANHFNALVDAVLVMHALGRLPRFVAKAALWRPLLARPFLWLAGTVPVHRPEDEDADPRRNPATFASCQEQLVRGRTVALFPEGRLSPVPRPQRVRTGAARIALGARRSGAAGLVVLPVGLVYEDKVALRSRALVRIGPPLDLDAEVARAGAADTSPDDPDAVRLLTAEIEWRLRAIAPAYRDEREGAVLGYAAEIALRETDRLPPHEVSLSDREDLGRRLAEAPARAREQLVDAVGRYHLGLSLLGLSDGYLVADYRVRRAAVLLLVTGLRLALLAPFALAGAAVNVLPYWAVHWAGRLVHNPALRASVRLLAGVVLFPAAWLFAAWLAPWDAWYARLAIVAVAPVLGLVAVRALEQVVAVHRAWRGWIALIERRGELEPVRADRARLVALVAETAAQAAEGGGAGTAGWGERDDVEQRPGL